MIKRAMKKPIAMDFVVWDGKNTLEVYEFVNGIKPQLNCAMAEQRWDEYCNNAIENGYSFKTLESDGETQKADLNDIIMKGINGECYPIKPDVFKLTYNVLG